MAKHVYDFAEGNSTMLDLLGGKGANLAEMSNLGLPVPPGFTITTEACRDFLATGVLTAGPPRRSERALGAPRAGNGQEVGRPERPFARVGA